MKNLLSLLLLLHLSGCATQNTRWGETAYQQLTTQRLLHSAKKTLQQPATWLPALGSLIFTLPNLDQQTSDWASNRTPVFGSQENARRYSDDLRTLLLAETLTTSLLTPSGDTLSQWLANKSRGISAQLLAGGAAGSSSEHFKDLFQRTRPDGSDQRSYPSGHATTAASYATLANDNLHALSLSSQQRQALTYLNWGLATEVAWARVEGQAHYPADVLAGMALGHFVTGTLNEFLMGNKQEIQIQLLTHQDGERVQLRWLF